MSTSQKRSRWVYIGLVLMLLALVCFSLAPLVSSIVQVNRSQSSSSSEISSNRLEAEITGYQAVLEREPDNQNALEGLLEARLRQGNLKGVIEPLSKLAQLNPQQIEYSLLLAQTQEQIEDTQGAIATYQTLLATNPAEIRSLKGLVDLLVRQNRSQEGIDLVQDTLKKAIAAKADPSVTFTADITALELLLGEIYVQQKKYNEAIAVYDQGLKYDPEDFRPLLAKALVLKEQGKETEAQPLFEKAINLAPIEYKNPIQEISSQITEKSTEITPSKN